MERSDGELSRHSKEREHRRAGAETSRPPPPFSSLEGKISEGETTCEIVSTLERDGLNDVEAPFSAVSLAEFGSSSSNTISY